MEIVQPVSRLIERNNVLPEAADVASPSMSLIPSNRKYSVGMGKDKQPNSRLWIQTNDYATRVHLYCLDQSDADKQIFACGSCQMFKRYTRVEIRHPTGRNTELWEETTHLPCCLLLKTDVEKFLMHFEHEQMEEVPARSVARRRTVATRSRSRLRSHHIPSATPSSGIDLSNSSANYFRRSKPNIQAMSLIPSTHFKLNNAKNLNADTKLFIFTDPERKIGREFFYGGLYEGGAIFFCIHCQRNKHHEGIAFCLVVNGRTEIQEANHFGACLWFGPQLIFDDENNNTQSSTEREYASQEPEATIEYNSASVTSEIPEVVPVIPKPKDSVKQKKTTLDAAQPSTTFRPVFSFGASVAASSHPAISTPSTHPAVAPSSTSFAEMKPTSPAEPVSTLYPTSSLPAEFHPTILQKDQIVLYNIPSSNQMRKIASAFGIPFNYKCCSFWSSTLSAISEVKGSSKPLKTYAMKSANPFSALSMFLTGGEEYASRIQEGIKASFCKSYFTDNGFALPRDVIEHSLITNTITPVHLSVFSKMINCSVGVFNGSNVEVYGISSDNSSPVMFFKKQGIKFEPVISIET